MPRRAAESLESVALATAFGDPTEVGADLRTAQRGRDVSDRLNHAFEVEISGDCLGNAVKGLKALSLLAQQFLRSFALSDVSRDFRCADHYALGIPDGRHRDRNFKQTSILASANSFKMVYTLTAP